MSIIGSADHEPVAASGWVDEVLLSGPDNEVCLFLGEPVDRLALKREIAERQARLTAAGLRAGGTVALRLPPSLAYIASLLAAWRIGAQVSLLDHRLTQHEIDKALERLSPQVVVAPEKVTGGALRAFVEVLESVQPYPGRPAQTPHAVIQLSSGSTGPSKVIGRTAGNLIAEIQRYTKMDGVPQRGERTVLLASMVHVLGLVGGLLYGLHAGVRLDVPERLTVDSILKAVAADPSPATIIGVPFHIELLASVEAPPALPQLKRMTTGGELVRAEVSQAFVAKYGVVLGNMYGMTEVGVIGTDLFGEHRPSIRPAPGIVVREQDGEIQIGMPASPYIGLSDPARWSDGWLSTKDAGEVDAEAGLVTIRGRLDSQVSVGGLKVDLTEVEHTLAALPGVASTVVVFDSGIEAYVVLSDPAAAGTLEAELAQRLAAYKRPREIHVVEQLPRTATGKLVRDRAALRETT
ncbi:class I adenylate-forming enzyme family protein [Longispora albida]|uniref:class I adenylate-forming enzyme family protein n=1 Tax=Longispora albida TaxID=203523 RepID=UPI0003AAD81E|nr:class I adenylate-forming enzyme family protein [Longispora albida]